MLLPMEELLQKHTDISGQGPQWYPWGETYNNNMPLSHQGTGLAYRSGKNK